VSPNTAYIEIGYFKEYDNKIASITTGNKKIKTFSIKEYKTYLKKSVQMLI
jgi:Trp operon repressor